MIFYLKRLFIQLFIKQFCLFQFKEAHFEEFIPYPEEKIKAQLNLSFAKADSIVPFTLGTVFRPNEEVFSFSYLLSFKLS